MTARSVDASLDFLAAGGDMRGLVRSLDWSAIPLGPPEGWPQSLRAAVSICLGSRFPIVLYWGPRLITIYNDAYAPILAKKHPWALGRPCEEVWAEIWDVIAPMLESVTVTREATWSDDQLLTLERHGYPEECYFSFSFSPVRGDGGSVDGIFTAVIEHTQRVIGERRIRLLGELAASVAEANSDVGACARAAGALSTSAADIPFALIYLRDTTGRSVHLSAAAGLSRDTPASPAQVDLASAPWPFAHVDATRQGTLVTDLDDRNLPGGPWPESTRSAYVLPIGSPGQDRLAGFLVAGVSPRRAIDDDYRAFLGLVASHIGTGITEARALEAERARAEALAELDRAKTAFFSNVSHEFRTPLTLMLAPLEDELAERADPLPPDRRQRLETAHRNSLRLLKLVNTLLDFSRIEAGRMQANYEPTALASYTVELASVFRSAAEKAGLELTVDCPPLPTPVYVDREMWEKIVLNLLSNALKHTFQGRVSVGLRLSGHHAELTVADTGVGIPAEELPRIFDRFHRVRGAKSRAHEGSGIGLALVQELARLHGGTIRVESEEGRGTTFVVTIRLGRAHLAADRVQSTQTLPATATRAAAYVDEAMRWLSDSEALPAGPPLDTSEAPPAVGFGARRPRLVWADDNADLRDYVARLLADRYDVTAFPDGLSALAATRDQPPDLVLADVMMPGLDGFGLLRGVRAQPQTRTVPVILLSARAGEESRIQGLEAGADDYLVKPFSARELLARVSTHLEMARVRTHAERAIRASEERYRALVEATVAIVWTADPGHAFVTPQPSWQVYTGQRWEDCAGLGWLDAVHPDDRDTVRRGVEAARSARSPYRTQGRLWHSPTNSWRHFDARAVPILERDGTVREWIGTCVDIHERMLLEEERERLYVRDRILREEAEAANRLKDEFLATLSHELRAPLNALVGWTHILGQNDSLDEQARHAVEVIERNTRTQSQLISDILDVSRIVSGKLNLDVAPLDLAEVVRAALDTVRPAAQAKDIVLRANIDPDTGLVSGDQVRLQQVLWNVLSNAVKFSSNGGRVAVRLTRSGSDVELTVQDEGIGISRDFIPHVFERFRQREASTARAHQGLGLGLAIVRHLVELHAGTVVAESDGEGRGATFRITLPAASVHSTRERADVQRASAPARTLPAPARLLEGISVLLVDDETDSRDVVAMILGRAGAKVTAVTSAPEALVQLERRQWDVLVSDIEMPGEDGLALIRSIRRLPAEKGGRIPAVALTAHARAVDRRRVLQAGYQVHVPKPVEPKELAIVIADLQRAAGADGIRGATSTPR